MSAVNAVQAEVSVFAGRYATGGAEGAGEGSGAKEIATGADGMDGQVAEVVSGQSVAGVVRPLLFGEGDDGGAMLEEPAAVSAVVRLSGVDTC